MTCCTICLPWVLLTSNAVLFLVALFGGFLACTNFGYDEPTPPKPVPPGDDGTESKEYSDYLDASSKFADVMNDERFYVVVPCVLTVMVTALVMLRGLCSRTFFNYTFTLYTSLGLWILTMTWIILYQTRVGWDSSFTLNSAAIILGTQSVLILALSVQVLLSVGVLRILKADWPTLNWRSLFTPEVLLIVARITLVAYTISSLFSSQLINGLSQERFRYYSRTPRIRFPLEAILVCVCAVCYNAIAIIETALSMLFGKMNNCMTILTTLLSALCSIIVAIIASPVMIRSLVPHVSYVYLDTLYFSIALSVVTSLHLVSCIGFPTFSRTIPQFLLKLADAVISVGKSISQNQCWYPNPSNPMKSHKAILIINAASSIYSVVSIIIILAVWDSPMYRAWGSALLLCVNSATLVRTLPPIITDVKFKIADNTPVNQRVIAMALECVALLVGGISTCAITYYPAEIFGGVLNLLFFCLQLFLMVQFMRGKIGITKNESTVHSSDTEDELISQNEENEEDKKELGSVDILA